MTEEVAPRKERKEGAGKKIAGFCNPLAAEEQSKIVYQFFKKYVGDC